MMHGTINIRNGKYLIMSSVNTKTCDTAIFNYNWNLLRDKMKAYCKIFIKFSFCMWSHMHNIKPRRCLILYRIRQYFDGDMK